MEGWKLQKKGEFIEIFNDENFNYKWQVLTYIENITSSRDIKCQGLKFSRPILFRCN